MNLGLKGKLAGVTGSSSGIGKATTLTPFQEGCTKGETAYFDGLAVRKGEPLDGIIQNYFQNDEPTLLIQRFVLPEEVARTIVTVAANKAANGGSYHIEGGIVRKICSQKWRIEKW